jgi:hypothetical protein
VPPDEEDLAETFSEGGAFGGDARDAFGELQERAAQVERCHKDWVEDPDDDELRAAFEAAWRAYEVAHQRCLRLPPLRGIEPVA